VVRLGRKRELPKGFERVSGGYVCPCGIRFGTIKACFEHFEDWHSEEAEERLRGLGEELMRELRERREFERRWRERQIECWGCGMFFCCWRDLWRHKEVCEGKR